MLTKSLTGASKASAATTRPSATANRSSLPLPQRLPLERPPLTAMYPLQLLPAAGMLELSLFLYPLFFRLFYVLSQHFYLARF